MKHEQLAAWLDRHPNPDDNQVHALARARGLNKHELEDRIYELATTGAKFKNNGDWNKKGRPAVDPKVVEEGAKIEMEHTDDPATARRIAMDHTAGPGKKNYYRNPAIAAADIRKEMKKNAALQAIAETAFADELNNFACGVADSVETGNTPGPVHLMPEDAPLRNSARKANPGVFDRLI